MNGEDRGRREGEEQRVGMKGEDQGRGENIGWG